MDVHFIEATSKEFNWGKFMLGRFTRAEWEHASAVGGNPLLRGRGWSARDLLVMDLQTGEGAIFSPGGYAPADLDKHRVWVCPLFEPFLAWLYLQQLDDLAALPAVVDLPDAHNAFYGFRREGLRESPSGGNASPNAPGPAEKPRRSAPPPPTCSTGSKNGRPMKTRPSPQESRR